MTKGAKVAHKHYNFTGTVLGPYTAPGAMPGSVLVRRDDGKGDTACRKVNLVRRWR